MEILKIFLLIIKTIIKPTIKEHIFKLGLKIYLNIRGQMINDKPLIWKCSQFNKNTANYPQVLQKRFCLYKIFPYTLPDAVD